MKGIPSLPSGSRIAGTPTSMSPSRSIARPSTEKKGGIKMLDITEQPVVGMGQNKRRKKTSGNKLELLYRSPVASNYFFSRIL